jgi:hypothetical protein
MAAVLRGTSTRLFQSEAGANEESDFCSWVRFTDRRSLDYPWRCPGQTRSFRSIATATRFVLRPLRYHSHFSYNGVSIKYASFPYLNCNGCSLAGKSVADMLTIVTSHEIREAVTDPGDSSINAWYDAAGYEADDKCAWHNLYQMTIGGFWVQPEYSNGGTVNRSGFTATYPGPGCIVPNR